MNSYLGSNQRVVLAALGDLENDLGPGPHRVAAVIDKIWHQQRAKFGDLDDPNTRAALVARAVKGDRSAVQALRISEGLSRRASARLRSDKRPNSQRVWAKGIEGAINPAQCFRDLARRKLIERTMDPGRSMVALTEAGRELLRGTVER
jgi:hypothetical protein